MNKIQNFYYKYRPDKILLFCIILFWIIFTLLFPRMHGFYHDEMWAWSIARDLDFIEIIKLMHYEGHTFLWYLILKPFTHFSFCFPFCIKYLNWIFLFSALLILWYKSPINNFIKILITISCPFLYLYPYMGRPYSLGILLLFILTTMYKSRFKHPILYSIMLFLTANVHIIATIGAMAFGFIFIYEVIKNKELKYTTKAYVYSAFIITALSLIIQWVPIHMPNFISHYNKIDCFKAFFFPYEICEPIKVLSWIIYVPLLSIVLFLNRKYKKFLFFILFTNILLSCLFLFVVSLAFQYAYYLYVYWIIAYWLITDNITNSDENLLAKYSLSLFIVSLSFLFASYPARINASNHYRFLDYFDYKSIVSQIESIAPEGSTLYFNNSDELYPFFSQIYKFKTTRGEDKNSFEAYKNAFVYYHLNEYDTKTVPGEKSYYITFYNIDYPKQKKANLYTDAFYMIDITKEK